MCCSVIASDSVVNEFKAATIFADETSSRTLCDGDAFVEDDMIGSAPAAKRLTPNLPETSGPPGR